MSDIYLRFRLLLATVIGEVFARCAPRVRRGPGVRFRGKAWLRVTRGASVRIGRGVLINSEPRGYHVSMFSRSKLYADRPGEVIEIGEHTRVHASCLHAYAGITIGRRCLIAANCQIIDCNAHLLSFPNVEERGATMDEGKPVWIDDDVWIGTGSIILPGTRIGRGSVIGAGSVVSGEIPPMSVAAGNPAKVIRTAEDYEKHRATAAEAQ